MSSEAANNGAVTSGSAPNLTPGVPATPVLECANIAKSFGPTRAIVDASIDVRAGEVHAVLGENGSGKSTLVKILSSVQRPDSGSIQLHPRERSTSRAHRTVATVFQEVLVVAVQSVVENVWLGTDGVFGRVLPDREKRQIAAEVLTRLCGRTIDLDAPITALSLSDQQACCIARALVREPDLLILDEATSALDLGTRDRFFDVIRELRAAGMGAIFISHRMDELLEIADRITVMRSGSTIATVDRDTATIDGLVTLMTGNVVVDGQRDRAAAAQHRDRVVLIADRLSLTRDAAPMNLELRAGEIIGIAGLEGHGQESLLLALWGGASAGGEVRRVDGDRETVVRSHRQAARRGIAYVPRDRRKASIFPSLPIIENFAVTTLEADARAGLLSMKAQRERFQQYRDSLAIRLGRPDDAITTLSGGNQQKVILARWLATEPEVLLLNDPTRGIDVGAKHDVYELLRERADAGAAIVLLSSELEEHLSLVDRVIVMREHAVFAEFAGEQITREALVAAYFGVGHEAGASDAPDGDHKPHRGPTLGVEKELRK